MLTRESDHKDYNFMRNAFIPGNKANRTFIMSMDNNDVKSINPYPPNDPKKSKNVGTTIATERSNLL